MANETQSFFRFHWLRRPNPTPQSRPTRPTKETRTPAPMTAALAGQRPAFSPKGIAPTQPPPSQPSKTEPQDQPASQPPSESRVTSQPPSPPRAPKESRATSQPPSPSRAPKLSRATSQPSSPSRPKTRTPSSPSRASSGSPSKSPSKPQPDSRTVSSQPQSPSRLTSQSVRSTTLLQVTSPFRLQPKAEVVSETPAYKEGSKPQSSETQREEKVAESQPPLQQPQMKMEVAPDKTQVAKDESPKKTTSQADNGGEKVTAQASDSVATPSPSQQEDKAAVSQPALTQVPKTESPKKTTSQADNDGEKGTAQASQQEDKAAVSQPALQESQPKIENTPEQTSISPLKTTSQDEDDRKATKAPAISPKEVVESTGDQKTLSKLEGESKPEREEEEEKTVEVLPKEEKTKSPAFGRPVQKPVPQHIPTVTTGRRKHTRDPAIVAFREEKRPQKQETSDEKNKVATTTTTTTSYTGRQIKTVSSSGNTSNTSFHKPFSSAADEPAPRQKEIKEDISKLVHKLTTEHHLVESPVSVITLTGENRGASMNVSSEPAKKEESIHIHRGYKLNPDDSAESTTDGEVNNTQGRRFKDHLSKEAPPVKAYANSNVQSINNSIVFNASVNGRNPGIHLEFSQDDAEPTGINGRSQSHQASRAEISITPSEKLTHEHTVKRRCLRGLLLESSDSEPDNPKKPRHHGCRYGCFENKKDKEFGA